ncbi:MAG TPA: hypothetical protein VEB19_17105 [Gemmatimonadaceae bacterium]|nr:hypothetical protein [Gemmatimonadaceae bacterium]
MRLLLAVLLCSAALTPPLEGQRLSGTRIAAASPTTEPRELPSRRLDRAPTEPSVGAMIVAGVFGGAVGLFGGGMIGYAMKSCAPDEWFCGLGEAAIGASIGELLLMPYGVHLASRHSSYGTKFVMSFVTMGIGMALAPATQGVSLLAAVPLQLGTVIYTEQAAARKKPASSRGVAR